MPEREPKPEKPIPLYEQYGIDLAQPMPWWYPLMHFEAMVGRTHMRPVPASQLTDLVEPGQPQCGATPPGASWPVCARPPDNHGGKHGRHESADYMWNDRGWLEAKQ